MVRSGGGTDSELLVGEDAFSSRMRMCGMELGRRRWSVGVERGSRVEIAGKL